MNIRKMLKELLSKRTVQEIKKEASALAALAQKKIAEAAQGAATIAGQVIETTREKAAEATAEAKKLLNEALAAINQPATDAPADKTEDSPNK